MPRGGHFRTCLMDPPWTERGGGIPTKSMPRVIFASGLWYPERDAHLWMWATNNYLADALWLGASLGFDYKTNVAWVKTRDPVDIEWPREVDDPDEVAADVAAQLRLQVGPGQYLRGSHELLLFFTHGRGQSPDVWTGNQHVPSVLRARRTKHARKPPASYDLIESVSRGPYLEMFARTARPGWSAWGNGVPS